MEQAPRFAFWPKRLLYVSYGCCAVIAGGGLGLRLWQIVALLLPLVVVEWLLRALVGRRLPVFERELMARIQDGAGEQQLLAFYREHHLLRFGAPRYQMQGKLALIHGSRGRHHRAATAYREALEDAPLKESFPLALGLADSLYEAGDHEEAEQVYRQSMDEEQRSGHGCANLARLIWRRGGDLQEAEEYMRLALDLSPGVELRCELVELLVEQGRAEDARWELQLATETQKKGTTNEEEVEALERAKEAVESAADEGQQQQASQEVDSAGDGGVDEANS